MQKLQNVHNMQNMQNVFSLLHLLISPRLFFHPAHVFTGTLCATNTYNVQCITICNSKQIFICMHTTPNIFSILIRPHVAPCWLFSSLYLVNINSAFIILRFSVAKLFVSFLQYSAIHFFRRPAPPLPRLCVPLPVNLLTFN